MTALDHLAHLEQLGRDILDDDDEGDGDGGVKDEAAADAAVALDGPRSCRPPDAALEAALAIWRLVENARGSSEPPFAEAQQVLLSGAPSLRAHSWLDSALALCVLGELCVSQQLLLAACMQLAGQAGARSFSALNRIESVFMFPLLKSRIWDFTI